jgi:glutamate-1-semialdehyde aminotransferase
MVKKLNITKSNKLWQRAKKYIPCGTQTLSKAPNQFVDGVFPKFLERGKGCYIWDVDGNKFIDYPMALGPIILGYDYPEVTRAVIEQIHQGTTFTLMHPKEVELAEKLSSIIPCAEMVRFAKNGSDATTAAIKVARAFTGKDEIAVCGYHGYQDWYVASTERNKGIPKFNQKLIHKFEYNNIESLKTLLEDNHSIGAVIMEQLSTEPKDNFLQKVIDLAYQHNAVMILDEIVTGFRYSMGGAQEYYNVKPDLACFGKGMANGYPLSALVGKKEIMKEFEKVFFSTTFGGEAVSLAAALATIKTMEREPVHKHIWELGDYFREEFHKIAKETGDLVSLEGNAPRSGFVFKETRGYKPLDLKSLFLQETITRGILFGGPIFITYSHTKKDIDKTIRICHEALTIVREAVENKDLDKRMRGKKIGVVFRPYRT